MARFLLFSLHGSIIPMVSAALHLRSVWFVPDKFKRSMQLKGTLVALNTGCGRGSVQLVSAGARWC